MACPPQPTATPMIAAEESSLGRAARRRLLWSYGLGDIGTGMAATQLGFYLFVFYTGVVGLPAWMAGLVLMLLKVWDGINDPLVGWLSDHTKHPWGPRLPWMAGSALPLGLALVAMWWVPSLEKQQPVPPARCPAAPPLSSASGCGAIRGLGTRGRMMMMVTMAPRAVGQRSGRPSLPVASDRGAAR